LFGYNVRNLTALETLDKFRRVLLLGAPPDLPGGDVAWAPLSSHSLVVSGGSSGFQLEVIDASRTVQFRFDPFPGFRCNVTTTPADVNGDGTPDLIAAVGSGGPGHVKAFDGTDGALIGSFYAFDPSQTAGVNLAAGDLDGDGRAEIVVTLRAGPAH